ncbi:glycoside hydrolase family 3 N-terminal domain-containing protein [Paeniglutamicibacter sp. MACA_103]|uniref:glycoside hydrolase family 3 N-terminal domain-containing protein n=1 Tax=Paeniglutamicibacter sp. MACA_103 TaxID=3377337 RepID=UPI00389681F0
MSKSRATISLHRRILPLVVLPALVLAGCAPTPAPAPTSTPGTSTPGSTEASSGSAHTAAPSPSPSRSQATSPAPSSRPTSAPAQSAAEKTLASLSLEERIGQVLMVGVPATGSSAADRSLIADRELGNFFLKGRSSAGNKATAAVVERVEATISKALSVDVDAFVATDQEGGAVQVLKGSGFSSLPAALTQGGWAAGTLRERAADWGKELAAAGVNVNLAPVADTVPSASFAPSNAPIGYWKREYGYDPRTVSAASRAFSAGMLEAGVDPVIKHFPGLGRVTKNTDTARNVTDTQTTRDDAYLKPFRDGIASGNDWVMVSNAYYTKIDAKNIAPFSSTIMRGMLREDLGFNGIIVSDDMCDAAQLGPWGLGTRAVRFFAAGGTMLLCVNAGNMPAIAGALHAKASKDPAFARIIDAAALRVLRVKEER